MVFHWSLSDSKSPQVSRTLLSILTDLNNVIVWMVSIRTLISKSFNPFNNPSVTVPRAPITIGIIVTFMLHSTFQFPSKVEVLIRLLFPFDFTLWSTGTAKIHDFAYSLFCWLSLLSSLLLLLLLSLITHIHYECACARAHTHTHTRTRSRAHIYIYIYWERESKNTVNASIVGIGFRLSIHNLKSINSIKKAAKNIVCCI